MLAGQAPHDPGSHQDRPGDRDDEDDQQRSIEEGFIAVEVGPRRGEEEARPRVVGERDEHAAQVLRDHRPSDDLWPTQHLPKRRAAAREKFAEYLEHEVGNL